MHERTLIARPQLRDQLGRSASGRVTVLSAPAGHGRRTLLRQWQQVVDAPFSWLTPALSPTTSGRGSAVWAADGLEAALAGVESGVAVVERLDPFESPAAVHWLLGRLTRGDLPRHVVAISASRWPPAPRHAASSLLQLTRRDLRFTDVEAAELLHVVAGVQAPPAAVRALNQRCMGWAAALRLVAAKVGAAADEEAALNAFTSDDPYLVALLQQEILAPLSARMQEFVLHTSVLDRLDAGACDAVVQQTGSGPRLRSIARRDLFVVVADDPAATPSEPLTLEPSFRSMLRVELRRREPESESELLRRAARWHLERDEPAAAARYLIEPARWDDLLEVVDRSGSRQFERGAAHQLLDWLDAVPQRYGDLRSIELRLRRVYVLTMLGRSREAAVLLNDLDPARLTPGEQLAADAVKVTWGYWHEPPASVVHLADSILARLDADPPVDVPDLLRLTSRSSLRTIAEAQRARALWYDGDVAASRVAFAGLTDLDRAYPPWRVHAHGASALLAAWSGELDVAERRGAAGLELARAADLLDHPATLDARVALTCVARERGDLRRAEQAQRRATTIAAETYPVTTSLCVLERALLDLALGRPEAGEVALDRIWTTAESIPAGVAGRLRAAQIRLRLATGDVRHASWLASLDPQLPCTEAAAIQAAVAARDLGSAQARLDDWQVDPAEPRAVVEHGLWAACLELQEGSRRRALGDAKDAVALAEKHGLVRVVLDAGEPVLRLLHGLAAVAPTPFTLHLLAVSQTQVRAATGYGSLGLSDRELVILRKLPSPASNVEIAAQLFISVNTLKTHLRGIYRKLDVAGRRQAVARAEELGLA